MPFLQFKYVFLVLCLCKKLQIIYCKFYETQGGLISKNFQQIKDRIIVENITDVLNTTGRLECQFHCLDKEENCSSFNLGKKDQNDETYVCELSKSDHVNKPTSLQWRKGYFHFGIANPCFSSPCYNGATCIADYSTWTYNCTCGLQINVLSYLDGKCSVDNSLVHAQTSNTYDHVFTIMIIRTYTLTFAEAERACEMQGAVMASYDQLYQAYLVGYQFCAFGWLSNGKIGFPMHDLLHGCRENEPPGIRMQSTTSASKSNVYCYKPTDSCHDEEWIQNGNRCYKFVLNTQVRYDDASTQCNVNSAALGVFNSNRKLGFVKHYVDKMNDATEGMNVDHVFVGLKKIIETWKWNDNNTVSSSVWDASLPHSQGPLGAVDIATGKLVDVADSDLVKLPFVCEKGLP